MTVRRIADLRVLVSETSVEPLHLALSRGIAPSVLFIHKDGWALGAPPFLAEQAECRHEWAFRLDIPDELRTIPFEHRACNACGGDGRDPLASRRTFIPCEVCQGKGYWSAKDIAAYHRKYPAVCRQSCGAEHHDPFR